MTVGKSEEKAKCPRCGGLGTLPTPDGERHQVCPICGGIDYSKEPKIKWE